MRPSLHSVSEMLFDVLEEANFCVEAICDHDSNENTPVYILANKQDIPVSHSTLFCAYFPLN